MKYIGFIFAIASAILWGFIYTIDQKILEKISPVSLIFLNAILLAIVLCPFFLTDGKSIEAIGHSGKNFLGLFIITILLSGVASILLLFAVKILGSSTASILEISYPFFAILFSFLLFGATINTPFMIGGGLIFVGSMLIILTNH